MAGSLALWWMAQTQAADSMATWKQSAQHELRSLPALVAADDWGAAFKGDEINNSKVKSFSSYGLWFASREAFVSRFLLVKTPAQIHSFRADGSVKAGAPSWIAPTLTNWQSESLWTEGVRSVAARRVTLDARNQLVWLQTWDTQKLESKFFWSSFSLMALPAITLWLLFCGASFFAARQLTSKWSSLRANCEKVMEARGQDIVSLQLKYDDASIVARTLQYLLNELKDSTKEQVPSAPAILPPLPTAPSAYMISILNAVQDGLLVVDESLEILPGASKVAKQLLEQDDLEGRNLIEALFKWDAEHRSEASKLRDTILTIFNLFVPEQYTSLTENLPRFWKINFKNQTKIFVIDLSPVVEAGEITKVLVTLSDASQEEVSKDSRLYAHHKAIAFLEQLQDLLSNKQQRLALADFFDEGNTVILDVHALIQNSNKENLDTNKLFRKLHTLKGNASALGLESVAYLAHEAEGLIHKLRDFPEEFEAYDYEELQSHIRYLIRGIEACEFILRPKLDNEESFPVRWSAYTHSSSEGLVKCAEELGKQIDIEWSISDEMPQDDFTVFKRMVVHLLRNSIDHGIEPPSDRIASGKDPTGKIKVDVSWEENFWQMMITDDGQGINAEGLRRVAKERNFELPDRELVLSELLEILCHPGFSSKEEVTTVSGRGVGMDAVAEEIRLLGGDIELCKTSKQGTVFRLYWPAQLKDLSSPDLSQKSA